MKKGIRHTLSGISGVSHCVEMKLHSNTASALKVMGRTREVEWERNRFGIYHTSIALELGPGDTIVVEL